MPKSILSANGTSLTYFAFCNVGVSDFSCLSELTKLTYIDISNNAMTNINFSGENLTSLTTLNLSSNKITALKGIDTFKSITTLDLSNNLLSDTSSYKDSEGNTITYNNLGEIVKLHPKNSGNLTTLKLSGNTGIIDYSPVKALSWSSIDV
jgi:Leucine-rich repeat (LRR) protein